MATKKSTKKEVQEPKVFESKEMEYFGAFVDAENLMDISLTQSDEEQLEPIEVIDSGSASLNDALGCDGLPCGRVMQYYGPPGCHRKGQGILMFNGTIKNVEDIAVGDQLMGMDSTPRNVLNLCRGNEEMAEIVPNKGKSFVVNKNHILTLNKTAKKTGSGYSRLNEILDISVNDYMNLSKSKKHYLKLLRTNIDFQKQENELPIDPYFLGLLLGDGGIKYGTPNVTTADPEIVKEIYKYVNSTNLHIVPMKKTSKAITYNLSKNTGHLNELNSTLRFLGLYGKGSSNKFIPYQYKIASRKNRLEILAGLVDTDGSYYNGCFEYVSISEQLINDVAFIARSLGFSAYPVKKKTSIKSTGFIGEAYRLSICGDISNIPTKIARKIAPIRKMNKNVLRTGFEIRYLPKEDYYGFHVDGDNRYLLDDFTITHNSGKSLMTMIAISNAQKKDPSAKQLFIDAEGTFDKKWIKKLGADPTKIIVVSGDTASYGRNCFEMLLGVPKEDLKTHAFIGKSKPGILDRIKNKELNINLIILDSLGAIIPPGEDVSRVGKMNIALMARFLGPVTKKLTLEIKKANIPMICINHVKSSMDAYGPDHTSSGGNSYFHNLSANVYFEQVTRKEAQILDEDENKIGATIRFGVEKSKFGPSPRRGEFRILFNSGITDRHIELILLGIKYGTIKRLSSVTYEYNNEKITGMPKLTEYFSNNEDLCNKLYKDIKELKLSGIEGTSIKLPYHDEEGSDNSLEDLLATAKTTDAE